MISGRVEVKLFNSLDIRSEIWQRSLTLLGQGTKMFNLRLFLITVLREMFCMRSPPLSIKLLQIIIYSEIICKIF